MKRLVMRLAFTGVFLTAGVIAIAHTLMKRQETEGEGPEGEGVALVNGVEDPDDKKKSPSAGGSGIQSRFQIGDTKVSPASGESQGGLGSGTDQNRYGGSPGVASGGAGDVGGYRSSGYGASGAAEQINRGQSAGEPKVLKIGDTAATRDAGASGATGTGAATGGSAMSGALNALRNSQSTAGASTGAVAGGSGGQATGGATQQQAPNVISIADSATGAGGGTTSSPAATGTSASQGYGTSYGAGGGYGATGGAGGYGSTSTGTGTAAADSGSGGSGTGSTAGAGRSTGTGTGSVAGGTGAGGVGGAAGAGGTGNGSQYGSTQYGAGSSSGATGGGTGQRPTRSAPSAVEIQPTYNKNYGVGGTGSSAGSSAGSGVDVANSLASDQPGSDDLEGVQRPALTLEKVGDRETQINVPTTIELFVKNTGNAVAHNVVVTDYVPGGATYDSADPQPQQGPQGQLVWSLGELAPDETKKITLEITPRQVGDIGSVATVTFETPASVRVRVTEPVIEIEQKGPEKVLIGEEIVLDFMVRNTGTGVAKNIVIEEDVPGGFKHTAGSLLEYEIGNLRPDESQPVRLRMKAAKAGATQNKFVVKGEGFVAVEKILNIEVVAPQLQLQVTAPKTRFLNRELDMSMVVANTGTAEARNVDAAIILPKGMRYIESKGGDYDRRDHVVYWTFKELAAQRSEQVGVTVVPEETGDQALSFRARSDLAPTQTTDASMTINGLSELTFRVSDVNDPVELTGETSYEIVVENIGSKEDRNVQVVVFLPPGLKFASAKGPTEHVQQPVENNYVAIQFQPIAKISPNDEAVFRIDVTGQAAGNHVIDVQVQSDERPNPVTKQESTRVFLDR